MQTTVRGIPPDLEHQLSGTGPRVGREPESDPHPPAAGSRGLNPIRKKRDLSALAGTWSQEEADEFDREVRRFEEIDDELWR